MTPRSMDDLLRQPRRGRMTNEELTQLAVEEKEAERDRTIQAAEARNLARDAILNAQRAGADADLKTRLCAEAGIPAELADRLQGNDAGELADDAKALAKTLGIASTADDALRGLGPQSQPPQQADDQPPEPPPTTSFDGGARTPTPPPAPSMSSIIRGSITERQERVMEHARDLDHQRRNR